MVRHALRVLINGKSGRLTPGLNGCCWGFYWNSQGISGSRQVRWGCPGHSLTLLESQEAKNVREEGDTQRAKADMH